MITQPTPKGAWRITFLLFLFMLVNFADKIVVGLAGVPIMTELKLEPEQFGLLGSSFFFLFSIAAIVVGFIVNRIATRWVLLALALIWALAQFPMVGTVSFSTLLICRVILGAGEGPAFSVAAHAVYKWFPDEKRTLPTAILSQGSAFGVILAVPALGDRQLFLALCIRRARHRRPDVGGGVADHGQGRAAGEYRRHGGGRNPHSLFAAFDFANLHRLLCRNVRRLLGAVARPYLVYALYH
jgi:biotin transporter BioY